MLWTDERIEEKVNEIGVPLSHDLQVNGAMRTMRDEYEHHSQAKDAYIRLQEAQIAALTDALNASRQRDKARF